MIEHAYTLIPADIEIYLLLPDDAVHHATVFLYDVVLYGVMIKHAEIGGINGNLDLVDELAVVEIDRLHRARIDLIAQKRCALVIASPLKSWKKVLLRVCSLTR